VSSNRRDQEELTFQDSVPASSPAAPPSGEPSGLDVDSITDAVRAAEWDALAAAGEAAWLPTRTLMDSLGWIHETTGLGWMGAIALTTVTARTLLLPVVVSQMGNTARMSAARPEMEGLMKRMKQEQMAGNTAAMMDYQKNLSDLWAKHDIHPLKSMRSIVFQAPLFLCMFAGLRHMAFAKIPSMTDGGALWFPDLTQSDPTYALPVLCSLVFLATVETGTADGMEGQNKLTLSRMKTFMRVLAVGMVPLTAQMPVVVFMYWITSNIYSFFQMNLFKLPAIRSFVGLPALGAALDPPEAASPSPKVNFHPFGATTGVAKEEGPAEPKVAPQVQPRRPSQPTFSSAEPEPKTYDVTPQPARATPAKPAAQAPRPGRSSKLRRKRR